MQAKRGPKGIQALMWLALATAAFLAVIFGGSPQTFEPTNRTTSLVVAPERLAVVELHVLGFT